MRNRLASILLIILISPLFFIVSGQKLVNSPYARFNLGILESSGSFRSQGMGGTGTAIRDNSNLYYTNPASYSNIDTNSFIFDFGIDYGINLMSDGSSEYTSDDLNFDHLLVGFPITKGLGVGAGISTYSNGYYSISETIGKGDPGYDPVTGSYAEIHTGEGGITKAFIGSGVRFLKYFSAGINLNLLFGTVKRINQFDFLDYYNSYNNNRSENLDLSGLNFEYGLQISLPLKNNYFINTGASYNAGREYKSSFRTLSYRYNYYGYTDTINFSENSDRILIPGTISIGFAVGKKDKLTAAFDYIMTGWSESTIHGSETSLADTRSIRCGLEYIPDKYSNFSLLRRAEYRIGAHFDNNYLVINGNQLKETGISLGFGIPLRRTLSRVNIYADLTHRYGENPSMHTENYISLGVSLNILDYSWFMKRKYE